VEYEEMFACAGRTRMIVETPASLVDRVSTGRFIALPS